MLYLLFALTFLAGILFYGMSPRDDQLRQQTREAEGMVLAFLNQHQAARDYLTTWLGASEEDSGIKRGNLYVNHARSYKALKAGEVDEAGGRLGNKIPDIVDFEQFLSGVVAQVRLSTGDYTTSSAGTVGLFSNMCPNNQGWSQNEDNNCPNLGFSTHVLCLNNSDQEKKCNDDPTLPDGHPDKIVKRYVYTFGGTKFLPGNKVQRPNWWPWANHPLVRHEVWRKAVQNRTRGSLSCGTLFANEGDYCINNGGQTHKKDKSCVNKVPSQIIEKLEALYGSDQDLTDLMFCYSAFYQGRSFYANNATSIYDSIAQAGEAEHFSNLNCGVNGIDCPQWTNLKNKEQKVPPDGYDSRWPFMLKNINYGPLVIMNDGDYINFCTGCYGGSGTFTPTISLPFKVPGGSFTVTVLAKSDMENPSDPDNTKGVKIISFLKSDSSVTDVLEKTTASYAADVAGVAVNNGRITQDGKTADAFCVYGGGKIECFSVDVQRSSAHLSDSLISWTLVKKSDDKMDIYCNVKKVVSDMPVPYVKTCDNATNQCALAVGGHSHAEIYAVRHWGSALTEKQIKENFLVDMKRFGLSDPNVRYNSAKGRYDKFHYDTEDERWVNDDE